MGDIYLEPEVIRGEDLMVFPLLMLVGFVYFAAFLGKFAEFISLVVSNSKKTLFESLMERLEHSSLTDIPGLEFDEDKERKETSPVLST